MRGPRQQVKSQTRYYRCDCGCEEDHYDSILKPDLYMKKKRIFFVGKYSVLKNSSVQIRSRADNRQRNSSRFLEPTLLQDNPTIR